MGLMLDPVPYIYSPPMSLYGGVVITDNGFLANNLERLLREVTDSFYQAYKVMNYINLFKSDDYQSIKSVIMPNSGVIDEKSYDYHSWNEKKVNLIVNHLKSSDKLQGIIIDDVHNKFYFAQLLGDKFDPVLTKDLLIAIQQTALFLSGEKASIVNGVISDKATITIAKLPFYDYFV